MEPLTPTTLLDFFHRLGERYAGAGDIYLLGGSALCLLGSTRQTQDIDYTFQVEADTGERFLTTLKNLAAEAHLDVEQVPLAEFIPLPPRAQERRRLIRRFGQLNIYIFDLYSIALSKIARGFEADLEDVEFLLGHELIEFAELERLFQAILPRTATFDIDPKEYQGYFGEIHRRIGARDQTTT
jgi:hypothetical protein